MIERDASECTSDTRRAQGDPKRSVIADCRGPKLELRCDHCQRITSRVSNGHRPGTEPRDRRARFNPASRRIGLWLRFVNQSKTAWPVACRSMRGRPCR